MAFCRNCGQELVGSGKYCASCGATADATSIQVSKSLQNSPYVSQPVVVAAPVSVVSGMGTAIKSILLWFLLAVILLAATMHEDASARTGVMVVTGLIAIAYGIGKIRVAHKRGAVVSNAWATYGAVCFLILMLIGSIAAGSASRTTPMNANTPQPATSNTAASMPPPSITADSLFAAYEGNEVAADETFKGRVMEITGRIGTINKDFMDSVYITLPSSENMFMGVHATIVDSETAKAASLRRGGRIRLACEVEGKVVTDVVVKNCRIIG